MSTSTKSRFNGIVQLVVSNQSNRNDLKGMMRPGAENTLRDEQCGEHITLAFKPTESAKASMCEEFRHGAVFQPQEVRSDGEITAVFGTITSPGVGAYAEMHVTIGGVASPVTANVLQPSDCIRDVSFFGAMDVHLHIVELRETVFVLDIRPTSDKWEDRTWALGQLRKHLFEVGHLLETGDPHFESELADLTMIAAHLCHPDKLDERYSKFVEKAAND